jgi:hypothetical protein
LLVVLFHIPVYHALKDVAAFANLQFCVGMFFALSGFVLCHAYGQRLNDGTDGVRFTVMRFARLRPLHAVMLALFVSLERRLGYLLHAQSAEDRQDHWSPHLHDQPAPAPGCREGLHGGPQDHADLRARNPRPVESVDLLLCKRFQALRYLTHHSQQ